jgi:hypothetical protein
MRSVVQSKKEGSKPFITELKLGTEYPELLILYQSKVKSHIIYQHQRALNNPNYCLLLRIQYIANEPASNMSDVKEIVQEAMEDNQH